MRSSIRIRPRTMAIDPFTVGVARLRRQPGATTDVNLVALFDPTDELAATSPGESFVPPGDEVRFVGVLESIPKGIMVTGSVAARWRGECRRCATEVAGTLDVAVRERFVEGADPEVDDAYPLDDDMAELGPMVRDAVVLELPLAPLCSASCKGLCVQCGNDLNEGPCGCEAPTDPRWATLDVLRDPEGG